MFQKFSNIASTLVKDVVDEANASLQNNFDESASDDEYDEQNESTRFPNHEERKSRLERQVAELEDALGQSMIQSEKLEERLAGLRQKLTESETQRKDLISTVDRLTLREKQLQEQIEYNKQNIQGKQQAEFKQLQDEIKFKDAEIESLRKNLRLAQTEKTEESGEIAKEQPHTSVQEPINQAAVNEKKNEEFLLLTRKLNETSRERDELQAEKNRLENRLQAMSDAHDKMQNAARTAMDTESMIQSRCSEYEAVMDRMRSSELDFKRKLSLLESDRRGLTDENNSLKSNIRELEEEVNALKAEITTKSSLNETLSRRLQYAETKFADVEQELTMDAQLEQKVNHLSAELSAVKGDLTIAQSDVERLSAERTNLNRALANLQNDTSRRTKFFESSIAKIEKQLQTEQQSHKESIATHELREAELLHSLAQTEKELSQLQDDRILGKATNGVAHDTAQETPKTDEFTIDDRSIVRKTLVKYFEKKRNGTVESQRELLRILASLLEMDTHDQEIVGLLLPENMTSTTEDGSLFKRIIFGTADKHADDANKSDMNYREIEQQLAQKPFADVWDDVLSRDL